jgi:hypothetical protein
MKCNECGTDNPIGANECSICGTLLSNSKKNTTPESNVPKAVINDDDHRLIKKTKESFNDSPHNYSFKPFLIIIVLLLLIGAGIYGYQRYKEYKLQEEVEFRQQETAKRLEEESTANAKRQAEENEKLTSWVITSEKDSMTDAQSVILSKGSVTVLTPAYNKDVRPSLIIRCKEKFDIYLNSGYQLNQDHYNASSISFRFDNDTAENQDWAVSTDGTSAFAPNAILFLEKLKSHQKLILKFSYPNKPPSLAEFKLTEFPVDDLSSCLRSLPHESISSNGMPQTPTQKLTSDLSSINKAETNLITEKVLSPIHNIGDTYTTEVLKDDGSESNIKTERKVVSVTNDKIIVESRNIASKKLTIRTITYTPEWNLIRTRNPDGEGLEYYPPLKYYDFPLTIGKNWKSTSTEQNTKTGATRQHTIIATVEGWDTVTTPAGTFTGIRVVAKTELVDPVNGQTYSGTDISWYVPGLRKSVKSETSSTQPDGSEKREIIQLLNYSLQ